MYVHTIYHRIRHILYQQTNSIIDSRICIFILILYFSTMGIFMIIYLSGKTIIQ